MVPHKTTRGAIAMDRLKSFDGIPHPSPRGWLFRGIGNIRSGAGLGICSDFRVTVLTFVVRTVAELIGKTSRWLSV